MAILAECPMCHRKQGVKNKLCSCGEDLVKAKGSKRVKYWISYRLPDGKQRRESVDAYKDLNGYSIEDANKAHSKRIVQKAEKRLMDVKPEYQTTFQELTRWYLDLEKVKALASYETIKIYLDKFNKEFGNMIVGQIKAADLENHQQRRLGEGMKPKTVDDEIGYTRTMVIKAFDNDMVGGETLKVFNKVKKVLKRNSNARDTILARDQFESLMEKLPRHAKPIVATGYYTGMRRSEILRLIWDKVDLKNRVITLEAEDTKDKEPRVIPICDELLKILTVVPRSIHTNRVFLYEGRPIKGIRRALKTACEEVGIPYGRYTKNGFIFHDLRHTFNTNMRKAGVAESVIMEITGHSTREMFDRYNTVDIEDTRKAIHQLGAYLRSGDQSGDQVAQNEKREPVTP
jgi:integrase